MHDVVVELERARVREADDPLDARAFVGDVEGRHVELDVGERAVAVLELDRELGGRRDGERRRPAPSRRRCRGRRSRCCRRRCSPRARAPGWRPVLRSMPWSGLPRLLPAQMPSSLALAAENSSSVSAPDVVELREPLEPPRWCRPPACRRRRARGAGRGVAAWGAACVWSSPCGPAPRAACPTGRRPCRARPRPRGA